VLVFANHPSDYCSPQADLLAAINARLIHAMEVMGGGGDHRAWWDYMLANLDDQAGDCNKIVWGICSDDSHAATDVYANMIGAIPTAALNPVYTDRRTAFKDMIRSGGAVGISTGCRMDVPSYTLQTDTSDGTALRLDIAIKVYGSNDNVSLKFLGCNYNTGASQGTLLRTVDLPLNSQTVASYYFTTNGNSSGAPLTPQQKANIKYIRAEVTWRARTGLAVLQPVRIKSSGAWWSGPSYTLSGGRGPAGSSPYPNAGLPDYDTVYFNTHTHSWMSDGTTAPWTSRKKYLDLYGAISSNKPCFSILTDHNSRTQFCLPVGSVITLKERVNIYGGFAGNETSLAQRDFAAHPTVIDGGNLARCAYGDGSTWSNKTNAALDGFTLTRGITRGGPGGAVFLLGCAPPIQNCYITNSSASYGGGVACSRSALYLNGCRVMDNLASSRGGGVFCDTGGTATVTNCDIARNTAGFEGQKEIAEGGGLCFITNVCTVSGSAISNNLVVSDNSAVGGGIASEGSAATIAQCTITGNTAGGLTETGQGGGVRIGQSGLLVNNLIAGNSTNSVWGGAYCVSTILINNTFANNTSSSALIDIFVNGSPIACNNIFAFNSAGIGLTGASTQNNCVYGNGSLNYVAGGPSPTDISVDPRFVDSVAGDYHLRSNSPCIDTGSNTNAPATDIDGRIRPQDGNLDGTVVSDIGAYEYPLSLGGARKMYANSSPITFGGMSVTAVFPASGRIYVEQPDRTSGVRVDTAEAFSVGQLVNVSGQILTDTATGECYVQASGPWPEPTGGLLPLDPLALKNRLLGGKPYGLQNGITGTIGLNNIGLLVKILGRVTASGTYPRLGISWFYIDDGSGLEDGSGVTGVYVEGAFSIMPPEEGAFVAVTGISSCDLYNGNLVNVLLPRSQEDIVVLAPAGGEDTFMLAGSSKTKAPPRLMSGQVWR
jgi:hypothetical protein